MKIKPAPSVRALRARVKALPPFVIESLIMRAALGYNTDYAMFSSLHDEDRRQVRRWLGYVTGTVWS